MGNKYYKYRCKCGCGKRIEKLESHRKKGIRPMYLRGHNPRGKAKKTYNVASKKVFLDVKDVMKFGYIDRDWDVIRNEYNRRREELWDLYKEVHEFCERYRAKHGCEPVWDNHMWFSKYKFPNMRKMEKELRECRGKYLETRKLWKKHGSYFNEINKYFFESIDKEELKKFLLED